MKSLFKDKRVCFIIDGHKSLQKRNAHAKRAATRSKDADKLKKLVETWIDSEKRVSKARRKKFEALERRLQVVTMDTKRQIFDAMKAEGLFVNCD